MTVAPVPRGLDLDALIDEARRRARLRRVALAAAILAAAAVGIGSFELTRGSDPPLPAPPGFTAVKARGPVAHALIESSTSVRLTSLTGRDRPVKMTQEVWYDARGGLWRDVVRVDGRVRSDRAGTCPVSREQPPCSSAQPLSYLRPWPSMAGLLVIRKGTFHGAPVVWLKPKQRVSKRPNQAFPQLALDAQTHRLVVERVFLRSGRLVEETTIAQRPTLSSRGFSFTVRKHAAGGIPQDALLERLNGHLLAYGIAPARTALGRTPVWLGARFLGYPLRSVQSGTYPFGMTKTGALRPAPYVQFYYGGTGTGDYRISVEEFGSTRPYFYKQGPRPGEIERDVEGILMLRLTHGGLLLRISTTAPFEPAKAIALAKALRPLPPGLKDLPSLRQQ